MLKKEYIIYVINTIILIDSIIGLIIYNNIVYKLNILISIVILITIMISYNNKVMIYNIISLSIILIIAFSTYNILIWYIGYELVIIPMIYLISKGVGKERIKNKAIRRFIYYTIISGIILLIVIIILYNIIGDLKYNNLINNKISIKNQIILIIINIISYLIKLPIIPLHLWLPETHGEASTSGSIYLAAIILKLGAIGIIKWLIPIFPLGYLYIRPLILIISIISGIYASIISIRHIDIKKLIAYSSISHMSIILIGLVNNYTGKLDEWKGVNYLIIGHGITSTLLFLLIGILYVRFNTRYLYYYQNLSMLLPLITICWFFSLLINASFPPSLSFFGEFFILLSQFPFDIIGLSHLFFALYFNGVYSILLFTKIGFNKFIPFIKSFNDLTLTEFLIFLPLLFLSFSLSFLFF